MSERIRVAQVICGTAIGERNGGAEMFAIRLAGALDPRRFEVSVCALWRYGGRAERYWQRELTERGIPVYYGGPHREQFRRDTIAGFVGLHHYLRCTRPQIINSHTEFADLVSLGLRRTTSAAALVRTCHNVLEWPFAEPWQRRTPVLYPLLCDHEVGVSRAIVELLDARPAARALGKRARYIPNAIHPDVIAARRTGAGVRAELGLSASTPLFVTVGRLSEQKGMPYLFEAMRLVREQLPDARLLVAGNGELADQYRSLLDTAGQQGYITLLGPRADAVDIIADADLFVSSSLWEGLPTVIMEAMLVGAPVVATSIAGTRDLVADGVTGLLAPPADAAALAGAMLRHYRERDAARAMAARAAEHIQAFTIPRVADAYAALYEQLRARAGRAGGHR